MISIFWWNFKRRSFQVYWNLIYFKCVYPTLFHNECSFNARILYMYLLFSSFTKILLNFIKINHRSALDLLIFFLIYSYHQWLQAAIVHFKYNKEKLTLCRISISKKDFIFLMQFDSLAFSIGIIKRVIEIRVFIEKYQRY